MIDDQFQFSLGADQRILFSFVKNGGHEKKNDEKDCHNKSRQEYCNVKCHEISLGNVTGRNERQYKQNQNREGIHDIFKLIRGNGCQTFVDDFDSILTCLNGLKSIFFT